MKKRIIMSIALLVAVGAQSALIHEGNLDTAVGAYPNSGVKELYSLDNATGNVWVEHQNGDPSEDTGVDANQWLLTSVSKGFIYSLTGGKSGSGAFVNNAVELGNKPRGLMQFVNDGGATVGDSTISMDVFFNDASVAGDLAFGVEVYGWNAGETGVKMAVAGGNAALSSIYTDPLRFDLGDAIMLLRAEVAAADAGIASNDWSTVNLGTVASGTGYDFYAWRFSVAGATDGVDGYAFDNVVIPEPATLGMISVAGIALVMARRKVKK